MTAETSVVYQSSHINIHQGAVGPKIVHHHTNITTQSGVSGHLNRCVSVSGMIVTLMDVFTCESVVLSDRYMCNVY